MFTSVPQISSLSYYSVGIFVLVRYLVNNIIVIYIERIIFTQKLKSEQAAKKLCSLIQFKRTINFCEFRVCRGPRESNLSKSYLPLFFGKTITGK